MQTYRPRWRFLRVYWPSFLGLTDNAHYVVLSLPLFQYAMKKNIPPPGKVLRAYKESPGGLNPSGLPVSWMRRRATLPHPVGCSTIAVPGLSFRVRNGTGRLTWAMAAANLLLYGQTLGSAGVWRPGNRIVDANVSILFVVVVTSVHCRLVRSQQDACVPTGVGLLCCLSSVSTGRLHPSRGFHVRPINHVFCMGTSRTRSPMECLSWSRLPA